MAEVEPPEEPARESARARQRAGEPVLPDRPRDETDVGWGDEPAERDDEWYRRERPPHHG